jgi:glutamyl-tRNA synthetase
MTKPARVRFAPSPTGYPHIGNIRTALFNWLWAKRTGGSFILRIEDTDRERYDENALDSIMEGLKWMGLEWDEGPGKGGNFGPYFQSQRLDIYHKFAEKLVEEGFAYWCNCSTQRLDELRANQTANKLPPGNDGHCRDKGIVSSPSDPSTVLRFRIPENEKVIFNDFLRGEITFNSKDLDDYVLLKSDGFPTYHMAVVIDDNSMEITHIMRAEEWIPSAGKHVLLSRARGFPLPELVHLPMILGPDRSKLSKRHGATGILEYRDMGYLPEAVFNFIALLGWSPGENREVLSKQELIEVFDIEKLNKASAVFDMEKLRWMNGEYIRAMSKEELNEKLEPLYNQMNWEAPVDYKLRVADAMRERLKLVTDMKDLGSFFFFDVKEYDEKGRAKQFTHPEAINRLSAIRDALLKEEETNWNEAMLESVIRQIAEERSDKAADLIHPLRLATSGMTFGPSAFLIVEIIGKELTLKRIQAAIDFINKSK